MHYLAAGPPGLRMNWHMQECAHVTLSPQSPRICWITTSVYCYELRSSCRERYCQASGHSMLQRRANTSSQSVCHPSFCKSVLFEECRKRRRGQLVRTLGSSSYAGYHYMTHTCLKRCTICREGYSCTAELQFNRAQCPTSSSCCTEACPRATVKAGFKHPEQ